MQYLVKVEFRPDPVFYELTLGAPNQDRAEQEAADRLYEQNPEYQGTDDGTWQIETEPLSQECGECGDEFPVDECKDDLCAACYLHCAPAKEATQ